MCVYIYVCMYVCVCVYLYSACVHGNRSKLEFLLLSVLAPGTG